MRKHILNPFTISNICGSFVSISYVSKKCFRLPASGKFGIFLTDNKLFTHGWTFFRSSIGITCGNNMLKRISFVFIFTLESTASISFWSVVSVECFLFRFPHLLSRKNFVFFPPVLLLGASEGLFWKGFIFFLPFSANISMAYFFDLAEATRYSLNFFPNKLMFISCHCNKSASSLNISLDCCTGLLRAAKTLYLLK